ncbi:MAG: flagellar hook-associated protein 3 FlgL [Pseudoalteromonas tetraodonis]|jgi:flagellar hook-associated protein 3 FlgL|uniref:Flagellar hook-associated protein 3 n=2 Tax=Pseudoalteromonas TaxID=53246 RepID=A0AA37W4S2_9GAMM|nr:MULTISPECIES: flagellar hook-associated protein FlgL [Pseudoalteromonas]MBL0689536.1 flagellar hook-associated protein FlgL [Pseudoalteromonas sp.]ADT67843.1 lateral flagellar hook-associated protein, LfgL [Pseudoalteromonas sp. SM9913]ALQ54193.1 Lateral flagellar hook-associated protein, LfgL [Pseudoalteromonas issachenkonii]ATC89975.1 flagellar hook-associated protein 3 FlgL [Pseudoalteromonas issachenkonii]ATD02508.1 flagellar hook-associated protein 3 FlgL [Pseudoalteromonas tetraodonis|tara:strand:+ start:545 stop:1441 length:897 start_codon:yes stop_codon:yes gene_type:complete
MRVSSHQFHLNSIKNIQSNTENFNEKSIQLATNKRILKPSDDPLGTVMIMNLGSEIKSLEQYKTNMDAVNFSLGQQEVQLTGIVNQIYSLQSLITTAADGSMGEAEIKALGQEMSVAFPAIVDLLNATDSDGQYYFSGSKTDEKPFQIDATGNYVYAGDDIVREVAVSDDSSVKNNIVGNDLDPGAGFLNAMQDYLVDVNNPPAGGVGNQSRVMIDKLADFLGTISSQVTTIGSTMASLDSITTSNLDITTFTVNLQDDLSAVDYPEAFISMNESMAAYESSMQVYSTVSKLSLFSYI